MEKWYYVQSNGEIIRTQNPDFWRDGTLLSAKDGARAYRLQVQDRLAAHIAHGTTIYCLLRSEARSGMSREISIFVAKNRDDSLGGAYLLDITYNVSIALGMRIGKKRGIVVPGCGMDMGFHLVYELWNVLWPEDSKKGEELLQRVWI